MSLILSLEMRRTDLVHLSQADPSERCKLANCWVGRGQVSMVKSSLSHNRRATYDSGLMTSGLRMIGRLVIMIKTESFNCCFNILQACGSVIFISYKYVIFLYSRTSSP